MEKKGKAKKSAKKQKYAGFSKVETPVIKTFEVSKKDREDAEKSYGMAMRNFVFTKKWKTRATFKRFCPVCKIKTIFNYTNDERIVCSCCGVKQGREQDKYRKIKTYKNPNI